MTRSRWTEDAVPSQIGRTVVITGANTGIGFEAARVLAAKGASVVLAVRSPDKGEAAAARIRELAPSAEITVQRLDLGSLDSVRAAAVELRAHHDTIDLLVNNAGVMYPPRLTTADGFELQLGTNHLGHFALTGLLLDRLLAVPGARVVTISSVAHRVRAAIHFDDLQWERSYDRIAAYGQSKLANLLFTYELQRRLATQRSATTALAAFPGIANTELGRNMPFLMNAAHEVVGRLVGQAPAMGVLPTLRAATDPSARGGQYYGPGGFMGVTGYPVVVQSSAQSHDAGIQERLWAVSEELTGVTYPAASRTRPAPASL